MNKDETVKILSEYMKRVSKKDIIETINLINDKISSMYAISTKDFSKFSELLKDYHSSIKQIENSTKCIEEFVMGEAQKTEIDLKLIYAERKKKFGDLLDLSHSISETFVFVQTLSDRILVPFNNLRQNVIAVQYLLASLRLSLSCNPLRSDSTLYGMIEELESYIIEYRERIDAANSSQEMLADKMRKMRNQGNMHFLLSNMPVESYINSASRELKDFSTTGYFHNDMFMSLYRHIQSCFSDLDEVVTKLQYHDIIRQKIEHIRAAQNAVLQGLDNASDAQDEKEMVITQFKFLARMPEVINVQVAQLMYINKDYQDSIEKITSMLLDVGREMKSVTTIFDKMTEGAHKLLGHILPELNGRQQQYIALVKNTRENIIDVLSDFEMLSSRYAEAKAMFSEIFSRENELRSKVEAIENMLLAREGEPNGDLIQRMQSVRSDLKCNSSLMISCFNTITGHLQKMSGFRHQLDSVVSPNAEADIMEAIRRNIVKYSDEAKNNGQRSYELSNFIAEATKNVEYYNYFKTTVDEIIGMMNSMNNRNNLAEFLESVPQDDFELLKYIESLYTMRSERDVYDEVLNKTGNNDSGTDDDIEFF